MMEQASASLQNGLYPMNAGEVDKLLYGVIDGHPGIACEAVARSIADIGLRPTVESAMGVMTNLLKGGPLRVAIMTIAICALSKKLTYEESQHGFDLSALSMTKVCGRTEEEIRKPTTAVKTAMRLLVIDGKEGKAPTWSETIDAIHEAIEPYSFPVQAAAIASIARGLVAGAMTNTMTT